ncbi:hypothetical protein [Enterococcus cecorum]|uniref:Uncharacterized protein n=2 Tax=Bacillota TaxID=1239 RepID=S1R8L8_9ENTE|nr:hypothetical protein [Enterococcus cecorum]HIT17702.1 hypothetical protein [Candidatus Caccosoma faecigallinarum]EOX19189.1 hypothetical protein I567_00944 [Enterococcus cecorum DSM 20682 = ATCC 43198]ESK61082.1 hypothetical protein OMO_01141 [Enterococcus cecorum DSM 20682 = ATCC 43198]CAI3311497.1 hypothetical protein CIRMBP1261_00677 [Enterococcus cecorum]CAI3332734.1 hypothetical protein CIRMBP1270_01028 [Enterococcus cecorum]
MLAYKISSLTMPEDGRFGSFQLEGLENIYFRFERQAEGYYLYPDFFKKIDNGGEFHQLNHGEKLYDSLQQALNQTLANQEKVKTMH